MNLFDSVWFHVLIWILVSLGLFGNVAVVLWRCSRPRDQRQSVLSMMIIALAVADFLMSFQMAVIDGFVIATRLELNKTISLGTIRDTCIVSSSLIVFTSSITMWVTFNIAIYSRQALTGRNLCCQCCWLVDRKYCFLWMLLLQLLFVSVPITAISTYTSLHSFEQVASRTNHIDMVTASRICSALSYTPVLGKILTYTFSTATIVSINSVLTVACLLLYLSVWRNLSDVHADATRSAIINVYWRLSCIVFINAASWVSLTVIEWYTVFNNHLNLNFTAAIVILYQISPTVNPFIYTITGWPFGRSVERCWKYLRCRVSLGRSRYQLYNEEIVGVRRCPCIPCVQCLRPWEYFDTEEQVSEETCAYVSNANRNSMSVVKELLPNTSSCEG